ncbi:GNAT family N-acetyltransferase [Paludibacterium paludis]|uniref:N-acetyltransferase n=1 Tax=Paludibacterium paludis TaxID=1225769 RepID=A0A918UBF5_9NEIS|nr:GNAT family N-acetyltransferase [Paludibacterium paludis]GGY23349.1 N-acetyltransferase [Paludibacterium paludis]
MLTLRPMRPDDFERFWPIFHSVASARETYALDPDTTPEQARHYWLRLPLATQVAEVDGHLVGSYFLKPNGAGPGDHVCNCGYMVAESARGRGVARAMCEHSQSLARDYGFLAMQFNSVVACNDVAVALWQKLGFDIVGRVPRAFRHGRAGLVDCLVMYKWLGQGDVPLVP